MLIFRAMKRKHQSEFSPILRPRVTTVHYTAAYIHMYMFRAYFFHYLYNTRRALMWKLFGTSQLPSSPCGNQCFSRESTNESTNQSADQSINALVNQLDNRRTTVPFQPHDLYSGLADRSFSSNFYRKSGKNVRGSSRGKYIWRGVKRKIIFQTA